MRGCSTHPYFEWTGRQCDESPDGVTSIGFIARENRNVMREIGGLPSEAWLEVMEDDERIGELFNSMVAPRLVVVDYKLHSTLQIGAGPGRVLNGPGRFVEELIVSTRPAIRCSGLSPL